MVVGTSSPNRLQHQANHVNKGRIPPEHHEPAQKQSNHRNNSMQAHINQLLGSLVIFQLELLHNHLERRTRLRKVLVQGRIASLLDLFFPNIENPHIVTSTPSEVVQSGKNEHFGLPAKAKFIDPILPFSSSRKPAFGRIDAMEPHNPSNQPWAHVHEERCIRFQIMPNYPKLEEQETHRQRPKSVDEKSRQNIKPEFPLKNFSAENRVYADGVAVVEEVVVPLQFAVLLEAEAQEDEELGQEVSEGDSGLWVEEEAEREHKRSQYQTVGELVLLDVVIWVFLHFGQFVL